MTGRTPITMLDPSGTPGQVPRISDDGTVVEYADAAAGTGTVESVNGDPGPAVVLDAADVGARASTWVPAWTDVTDKPATFTPTAHQHPWADITGAPTSYPPSGPAGGSLAGTYPNPTLAAGAVNSAEINAAIKDAAAATASLRTLGTGALQAAAGNDPRLSDARTPLAHVHAAADVTYAGSTNLAATNVEAALDELDAEKAAVGHTHAAAWTTLTLAAGYVSHADNFGHAPSYRLVGDRVELRGTIRPSSGSFAANTLVTLATMPTGFRPTATSLGVAAHQGGISTANVGRLDVTSAGVLSFIPVPSPAWMALDGFSFTTS